jgi:phthalate 4,5-dioxygenase oxygenase subunit
MSAGKGIHVEYEDLPGSLRPKANRDNDYLIDRVAQHERRAYSGIFGFSVQDASLQESMGVIQNHEAERLLPTDRGIVMARRALLVAAANLAQGVDPPALDASAHHVRAASVLLDRAVDPVTWASEHLANTSKQPVYSL